MRATAKRRRKLLYRDGDTCFYCGNPFDLKWYADHLPGRGTWGSGKAKQDFRCTVEHLRARSNGGTNHPDNLVLAHQYCNGRVGAMSLEEKLMARRTFSVLDGYRDRHFHAVVKFMRKHKGIHGPLSADEKRDLHDEYLEAEGLDVLSGLGRGIE